MIEPNLRGNGKVALVTGAARGIGLGISAWLIAEGWQVVLADNDRERGARVAEALGEHAWFVAMDVAQEGQVATSVAEVLGQFGRLDGLVCNAAIANPRNTPLEALSLGAPIALARASCLPELYGDTARYFDPEDYEVDLDALAAQPVAPPDKVLEKYSWDKTAAFWLEQIRNYAAE